MKDDLQKLADALRGHIQEANALARELGKEGYAINIDFKRCDELVILPDPRIEITIYKETTDREDL